MHILNIVVISLMVLSCSSFEEVSYSQRAVIKQHCTKGKACNSLNKRPSKATKPKTIYHYHFRYEVPVGGSVIDKRTGKPL